jgi:hypothetical protein
MKIQKSAAATAHEIGLALRAVCAESPTGRVQFGDLAPLVMTKLPRDTVHMFEMAALARGTEPVDEVKKHLEVWIQEGLLTDVGYQH